MKKVARLSYFVHVQVSGGPNLNLAAQLVEVSNILMGHTMQYHMWTIWIILCTEIDLVCLKGSVCRILFHLVE